MLLFNRILAKKRSTHHHSPRAGLPPAKFQMMAEFHSPVADGDLKEFSQGRMESLEEQQEGAWYYC